ncbi:MAG: IS1634 family transposase, partial [Bacillota bacterium]
EVFNNGPAPVISAMCRSLGITQALNRLVEWDERQCKLAPGLLVEAIIINVLCNRKPLYRMHEYFSKVDVPTLFGPGIQAAHLNDDALARALDKLAQAGPGRVYGTIALEAAQREGVDLGVLHADTTSVSVQGAYEDNLESDALWLTHGHSKDRRPDLKQFLYGLGTTADQVPVIGEVRNGNLSDKTWNLELISRLAQQLGPLHELVYVADSSLVTGPNLEGIHTQGLKFISRLPATFKLEAQLKDQAWACDAWQEVGVLSARKGAASYRLQSFLAEYEGRTYRCLVVHSSHLDGRKAKAIERQLDQEEAALAAAGRQLAARAFACAPDAHEAWREFCREHEKGNFSLAYELVAQERIQKRSTRGRPPRDYAPQTETVFTIQPRFTRDQQRIQETKRRASCFVLITNLLDVQRWPHQRVLTEYKQQTVVEQHFAFMKDPKVVGPVYLKKPARVQALAYVFLLALLVYSLMQRRIWQALQGESEPLEIAGKLKTFKPTGRRVLELFEVMLVIRYANGKRSFPTNQRVPERALRLLGLSPDIYLHWKLPEWS